MDRRDARAPRTVEVSHVGCAPVEGIDGWLTRRPQLRRIQPAQEVAAPRRNLGVEEGERLGRHAVVLLPERAVNVKLGELLLGHHPAMWVRPGGQAHKPAVALGQRSFARRHGFGTAARLQVHLLMSFGRLYLNYPPAASLVRIPWRGAPREGTQESRVHGERKPRPTDMTDGS